MENLTPDQKNLPKPELDLPLPEKKIPAHLASKGDAFRSYKKTNILKSKFFLVFLALSFLIAFLIGGFALGKNSANKSIPIPPPDEPTYQPTPTSGSFPATANWRQYVNVEGEYSFRYPSDYKIMENQKSSIDGVIVKTPNTTTIISSELQNLKANMQISIHYEDSKVRLSKDDLAIKIGTKTDGYDHSLDEHRGFWFPNTEIGPWGSTIIFTQVNGKDYTVTVESPAGYSHQLDYYISQFLSTFKFTNSTTTSVTPTGNQVACTQEAKQCPDGSYVGRTGPNCEFSPCPVSQ